MKKYLLSYILILSALTIFCQRPDWDRNTPISSSGKFCYISVYVQGDEDPLVKALDQARSCLGVGNDQFKTTANSNSGSIEIEGRLFLYQLVDSQNDGAYGKYMLYMFGKKEGLKRLPKHPNRFFAPLALGMSAVIPGTGQMYKQQKGRGILFLSTFLAASGTAVYSELRHLDNIEKMQAATSPEQEASLQKKIDENKSIRNIGIGVAGTFYVLNVVDALFSSSKRYALNSNDKKTGIHVAYDPGTATPTLGISFKLLCE